MYERHVEGIVNELVDKLDACGLLTRKETQKLSDGLAEEAKMKYKSIEWKTYISDKEDSPPKLDETRQDHPSRNYQSPASIRSRRVH